MRRMAAWILLSMAGTFLSSPAVRGQGEPSYVIEAPVLKAAPKLDGKIGEEEWKGAAAFGGFTQFEPEPGAPATERTEVRVGYDERRLYLGVRCYDSEPQKIVAVAMDRDADLSADDALQIVLDTFHDRSDGFLFETNPLGAQRDALVRNEGDEVNYNWDGIWTAATSRDDAGWTAEIAIPFRTLRFSKVPEQVWGINVGRAIARKVEYSSWRPVSRAQAGGTAIFRVSQAGELTGLHDLKQGRGLDIKPYVLAEGRRSDLGGDTSSLDAGLDLRQNIASNLVLDLTYNLDFAEAEADEQQVNITRFPLFFPEKREFFLEGASIFTFGERADVLRPPERIFFFSRRIGLSADGLEAIPVLGGAKISGTAGRLSLGFLNLTTEDHRYLDREGEERFEPQTNYTVLRLKQDVLEKSSLGFMGLNKAVSGGDDHRGAGVDWNFALGKYLKTGGFLADTSTPGLEGASWAGMVDFVWEDEKIFAKGSYAEVGEDFNPEMGFFTRLGIRETRAFFTYHFTPQKLGLRDVYLFDEFVDVTDRDGNVQSRTNRLEANIFWPKFWGFALKFFDRVEAIDVPFEISPGVVIPPGRYEFNNFFIGWQSVPARSVLGFTQTSFGEFWDGDFLRNLLGMILRPVNGLTARLTWERTDVDLPAGEFTVDLVAANVVYAFNPRISLRTLGQWRSGDNFDLNLVFRWIYRPGAALYVVYDEFRDLSDPERSDADLSDRSLLTKVSFYL